MDEARPEALRHSRLIQFFVDNPWVGALGSLASILGIPLAFYFYSQSVIKPDLVYYVNPVRTVIAKQGAASRLTISFDSRQLFEDVTAVQVAVWNRGRQAIRADTVLRPLVIRTVPAVPILEATIRTKSREVVSLRLNEAQLARGEVGISWNILEQADGGVVQLVYSAGPETEIECIGVLEGQPEIRQLKYSGKIKSPSEQIARDKWLIRLPYLLLFLSLATMSLLYWSQHYAQMKRDSPALIAASISILLSIGLAFYLTFMYSIPRPPFGFQ